MNAYLAALRPAIRAFAVALSLTLATLGFSALSAPAQAGTSAVMSMSASTYESKVQMYINKQRTARGLQRLRFHSCTDGTAERWAKHLASTDSFYHQSMGTIINRCNAYYAGETLGRGAISPRRLVILWMNSPAHKDVLLSRHARRIGIGAYVANGQWVTAANFTKF